MKTNPRKPLKSGDEIPAPGITANSTVELLDTTPLTLRRPLALIGDQAYAAIWPHVRTTVNETIDAKGKSVRHDPPLVTTERRLCVVRNDAIMFGDGNNELSDLGLEVLLSEIPPDEKLWSPRSAKRFVNGERPNPCEVFSQVADVVDRFIDFDRSLADQRTMAEMVSCYIIATWFLDAFTVIGFMWPNGERGSGKTQLLALIAELAYLGQMILAGGSYACLRDLADYGATLCFDDAENFATARSSDPDKRALLLAGNRLGAKVTVKEPGPDDRKWRTRYVNAFCPRAFSAIRLPDDVLASRSIIVPLIRTADRSKGNADPLEYTLWPHDRRSLIDSLWSLGLTHLPDLQKYEGRVNRSATLTGRNLEPWRALLAVAAWLEDVGVSGLYARMERLSVKYQKERQEFETSDLVTLVLRALCKCLGYDVVTLCDLCDVDSKSITGEKVFILTADIERAALEIAETEELDLDSEFCTERRAIGRTMSKLRFERKSEGGTHRRGWKVGKPEVAQLLRAFGLVNRPAHSSGDIDSSKVTNVTEGHNVTDSAKMDTYCITSGEACDLLESLTTEHATESISADDIRQAMNEPALY